MRLVRQNYKNGAKGMGLRGGIALLALTAVVSGCADDGSGGVWPAHGQQPLKAPPARALDGYASKLRLAQAQRVAAAKRWGLARTPLTAPPAPARKPVIKARKGFEVNGQEELGLPPVFTTIPTKNRVVFLTIDDGAEKDPRFLRMMSELKIPYTAFLSNYLVKDNYRYFRKMRDRGITLNNHTLTHPYLPGLSYAEQKHEICGMQRVMRNQFGRRPTVFRPRTATTTRTPCAPRRPAASSTRQSGTRKSSSTTGSTASGTATCTPATSSSATSGAGTTGRAPCPTWSAAS